MVLGYARSGGSVDETRTGLVGLGAVSITGPAVHGFPATWEGIWEGSVWNWGIISPALFKVFYSYAGLENANNVMNEVRDPVRTLRSAAPTALVTTCLLYLLINVAYFLVLPLDEIKKSGELVAALFFERVLGQTFGKLFLPLAVAVSAAGNVMVVTFAVVSLGASSRTIIILSCWTKADGLVRHASTKRSRARVSFPLARCFPPPDRLGHPSAASSCTTSPLSLSFPSHTRTFTPSFLKRRSTPPSSLPSSSPSASFDCGGPVRTCTALTRPSYRRLGLACACPPR